MENDILSCPLTDDQLVRILQTDWIIPEAKLILLAMLRTTRTTMTLNELENALNCPLADIDQGRIALFSKQINVSRDHNTVTISKDWVNYYVPERITATVSGGENQTNGIKGAPKSHQAPNPNPTVTRSR